MPGVQVVHELLVLEMLLMLLEAPSDSSIEVAVSLGKEAGAFLQDFAPASANQCASRFTPVDITHDGTTWLTIAPEREMGQDVSRLSASVESCLHDVSNAGSCVNHVRQVTSMRVAHIGVPNP
jgi:hypothetical protein